MRLLGPVVFSDIVGGFGDWRNGDSVRRARAPLRRNHPPRCVVASARGRLSRAVRFPRVFDVGDVSAHRVRRIRPLPLPDVLAAALRHVPARLVRRTGRSDVVAIGDSVLRGDAGALDARRVSRHLLLLPRRVLQSVLGRSAGLRCRRAPEEIPGRAVVSARHPEHPSVFSLPRARASCSSSPTTSGRRYGSRRRVAGRNSVSASARLCLPRTPFC